jgi:microcystin-dependent protein
MAAIWPGSNLPQLDASGDPMVGAKLYFFDTGTTTPQSVYTESGLGEVHDQPILADANGRFPAIFLSATPGSYRVRLLSAADVTIYDVDGVSVAQVANYEDPGAGDTSASLLFQTGMRIGYYGTTAPSGWVRAAGRTIGSAASGATERANADCQALFEHLWTVDSNLTVSTGRGASASGDWAANKTITLPDYRERVPAGLATMGNTDAGLIADSLLAANDSSTLGAKGGVDDVALTVAQMPSHNHTGSSMGSAGAHSAVQNTGSQNFSGGSFNIREPDAASTVAAHTHTLSIASQGSGAAHTNLQPTIFELVILKL